MEENQFYTSIEDAKKEIQRRWSDVELRKKVEDYLEKNIPEGLKKEPRAVLFRNVIILDFEYFRFAELADKIGIKTLGLEYVKDKFCTQNSDKLCYGKIPIFEKRNNNGDAIIHYEKIIRLGGVGGKDIDKIKTLWDQNIVEFHHEALRTKFADAEIADMSDWLKKNGAVSSKYYSKMLALFVCHGILFESFVINDEEARFFKEVVVPAFNKVKDIFGVKPLIVDLYTKEEKEDVYWQCCPLDMKKIIMSKNKL